MRYVWTVLLLVCAAAAVGCVGVGGSRSTGASRPSRPSRLLPWNWFAADGVALLDEAEGRVAAAREDLVREAQADVRASGLALSLVEESRAVVVAREFNARADVGLGQALGAVMAGEDARLRELVGRLSSELDTERAAGERELAARDRRAANLAEELSKARARESAATERLKALDVRYQDQAQKYRRMIFWVVVAGVVWLGLQVLAGAAKFAPSLGPVARLAGLVSAPVSQILANRSLGAVGRALAGVERLSRASADFARGQLDAEMDSAEQRQIRAAYERARGSFL